MRFDSVKWKKQTGSLTLSDDAGIEFRSSEETNPSKLDIPWSRIVKHQVSPVSYPKALLKLQLNDNSSTTFQFPDRDALEQVRSAVTQFLKQQQTRSPSSSNGKKRTFSEVAQSPSSSSSPRKSTTSSTTTTTGRNFGHLDPTALAVTRSTLLAALPNLRQQHHYLVNETQTVSEDDFWLTHQDLLEEEYARMAGVAKAGSTSLLRSHVPAAGKVTLGVEEMRQIFILYPAVHKAYEEKVPLALSDEEFWRKYLESEYFHRDRGRIGTAARNHQPGGAGNSNNKNNNNYKDNKGDNDDKNKKGPTMEEQDARAAAVSADDLFSRYEQKLNELNAAAAANEGGGDSKGSRRRWGTKLAVGQFDLAQTMETERGKLVLEGMRDFHPPNPGNNNKGNKVIEKYNRHWAMVLHPDEAVAGSNLLHVARNSVHDDDENDNNRSRNEDAKAGGGRHEEMQRLSDYASARTDHANHAIGVDVDENYETLSLQNIEVYYRGSRLNQKLNARGGRLNQPVETEAALAKRHADFSTVMAAQLRVLAQSTEATRTGVLDATKSFPPDSLGRELLNALTKKMREDSKTEAASLEIVNNLPDDFRNRLQSYFRRSSELLRHFFGLRRLEEEHRSCNSTTAGYSQKLARINTAMANFYREMEGMRRDLPQTETGEMMRKMCLPIMDQLDWAFKLHREGSGGGGGGFVDVDN